MLGTYHLNALFEILNMVHFIYDPQQLWDTVLDACCKTLKAEAGTFFEVSSDGKSLRVSASYGVAREKLNRASFQVGMGISGWVAQYQQPLLVENVRKEPRFNPAIDSVTGFTTRSILCVPIFSQKQNYGVIELLNKNQNMPFSPQDQEFTSLLAKQAAIAYQNLQLMESSARSKALLDGILASMSGGLVAIDPQRNVLLCNPAATAILNLGGFNPVGRPASVVLIDWAPLVTVLEETLVSQQIRSRQELDFMIGPEKVRLGYSTIPIADSDKHPLGAAVIFQRLSGSAPSAH